MKVEAEIPRSKDNGIGKARSEVRELLKNEITELHELRTKILMKTFAIIL
jgi:hypothetical protein